MESILLPIILGVLQGFFEWLPISSEGNITVILTALGQQPGSAVSLALFLHLGTAVSATAYYRATIWDVLLSIPEWWHGETTAAPLIFYGIATLTSGIVGISCYVLLQEIITAFAGGTVVVIIGCLLIFVGLFQRLSATTQTVSSPDPRLSDALLVGAAQGIAILPGITRSGMTTGTLLLRGYDGADAFEYSFVLSIPAAVGGGLLAGIDAGLQGFTPVGAFAAFLTAAVVGYLSIDVLLRLVERIAFWAVCLGLGGFAVVGGVLVL